MNRLEKALAVLVDKGIDAKIENDTIYIIVNDYSLELSEFEIEFQINEFNKFKNKD